MKPATWAAGAVSLLLMLSACANALTAPTTPGGGDEGGGSVQDDSLFVYDGANSTYSFYTTDASYVGPNGYTLWSLSRPSQSPFLSRDVTLVKSSGNLYAGFGIVFCEYALSGGTETMLVAMINANGQYSVGEATGSVYAPYTASTWVDANALSQVLNKGYGASNELALSRDAGSGQFSLMLNGVHVFDFKDQRLPLVTGGGEGYLAVISPQESFPDKPVSIVFTEP